MFRKQKSSNMVKFLSNSTYKVYFCDPYGENSIRWELVTADSFAEAETLGNRQRLRTEYIIKIEQKFCLI